MGEQVRNYGSEMAERWHKRMPRFFRGIVILACFIGGMAFSINTGITLAGGTTHEWWNNIYPYIIGGSIGVIFACKFTVAGGYKHIDPDKLTGRTILDKDDF